MRAAWLAIPLAGLIVAGSVMGQQIAPPPGSAPAPAFVPIPDWLRDLTNLVGERCVSCPRCQPIGPGDLDLDEETGDLLLRNTQGPGNWLRVPGPAILDFVAPDQRVWACVEWPTLKDARVKCLIPPPVL